MLCISTMGVHYTILHNIFIIFSQILFLDMAEDDWSWDWDQDVCGYLLLFMSFFILLDFFMR